MKKIIIIPLLLLFCTTAMAQELSIKGFQEATNDLSARTHPRQDNNGIDCALVKVQIAVSGVTFTGNVMGDVTFKNNEYWVYMTEGSKRLKVVHPRYIPLDVTFADYEITALRGKSTYILTIALGDLPQGVQQPKVQTGWIILDSTPQGASVYINDDFVGNTPLGGYKQPYGTYTFRVELPNYHPTSGSIELNSNRFEKKVTLQPAFGSITVTSNVAGAKVLLDGKATGKQTPCTLKEIASGQHTVTLQMEKYAPQQLSVNVEDGQTTKLNATLDARFAKVSIQSLVGAQIYCNGEQVGTTSYQSDMMEGYYDLEVRLAHHQTATKQIQVIAGQPQKLTLNPIPIYGSLDITSTPYDADVTIDGKSYGKTPLTVEQLLEGKHNVVLSKDGMLSESISVVVEADKTATASATLKVKPVQQPIQQQPVQQATPSSTPSSSSTQTFTVKGVSFNMIFVEGGTFTMGATLEQGSDAWDDEKPGHQVTLSSYYIGETEVTQALWKAVMGSNPSSFKGENRPVESVSWDDCKTFIRKLNSLTGKNFRLPSEAEWEFAARGGNKSQGYKYSGSNTLGNVAWYFDNSGIETHSVKSKSPNELGIYDMSGNVWEWCQDWYGSYSSSSQTNPTGASSGSYRVSRGGGWNGDAGNCRVSLRFNFSPGHRNFYLGLRLAL